MSGFEAIFTLGRAVNPHVVCIWDCQLHFIVVNFLKFGQASVHISL